MDDEHDPDREAIMARRRRFIAMAIGGLATGCTPGKPTSTSTTSQTNTSTHDSSSSGSESGSSETGDESDSETGPSACLKFDLPPEPDLPETGSDESDSGTDTGTTGGPLPCRAGFR